MSNGINSPYGLKAVESVSGDGATRKMKDYRIAVAADGSTTAGPLFYGDPVKFQPGGDANTFTAGTNIMSALTPNALAAATQTAGAFLGTFIGCTYQLPNQARVIESNFWPGNLTVAPGTSVIIYVNDDPNTVFKVQMSTSTNNTTIPALNGLAPSIFQRWMVGQNALLQLGGVKFTYPDAPNTPANNPATGNTSNSRSAVYLDGSSITLTHDGGNPGSDILQGPGNPMYDVKIIGLAPSSNRSFASANTTAAFQNLTPGVDMPFCDVLIKFNRHVFGGPGVAGPFNAHA